MAGLTIISINQFTTKTNFMDRNNSIITEDGQRLTIDNGEIVGTENPGPGLAYETGNTELNEPVKTEAEEQPNSSAKKD